MSRGHKDYVNAYKKKILGSKWFTGPWKLEEGSRPFRPAINHLQNGT